MYNVPLTNLVEDIPLYLLLMFHEVVFTAGDNLLPPPLYKHKFVFDFTIIFNRTRWTSNVRNM